MGCLLHAFLTKQPIHLKWNWSPINLILIFISFPPGYHFLIVSLGVPCTSRWDLWEMFCWLSDCIYSPNENICPQILMMLMPTRWLFDTWNVFCLNNLFQQFPQWCRKFRSLEFLERNVPGMNIKFYENLYTSFWVEPEETWCHQKCLGIQWRLSMN